MTTIKTHSDQINSIDFCNKNGRLYILVASSDCSVSLSDIKGNLVGVFGQEMHWKLEPCPTSVTSRAASKFYSPSFTAPRGTLPLIEISASQIEPDDRKPSLVESSVDEELKQRLEEEYKKNCYLPRLKKQLSVASTLEFDDDAFVNNTDLRYNPWSKTILGSESS